MVSSGAALRRGRPARTTPCLAGRGPPLSHRETGLFRFRTLLVALIAAVVASALASALLSAAEPPAYGPPTPPPPAQPAASAPAPVRDGSHSARDALTAQKASLERRNAALRAQIRKERKRARSRVKRMRTRADRRIARATIVSPAGVDAEKAVRLAAIAYGLPQERMLAIARCESTLNPSAVSGPYLGLFQFGTPLWNATPYAAWGRDDPQAAALAASWAFARGMDRHWPVCGRR